MRRDSAPASIESKRHSSTFAACSAKSAKLTPAPSHVAPSGYGRPGQTRRGGSLLLGVAWLARGAGATLSLAGRSRVACSIASPLRLGFTGARTHRQPCEAAAGDPPHRGPPRLILHA